MPKSRRVEAYDTGKLDLLEAIIETRKPVKIPFATLRQANAERLDFYGLRSALIHNNHTLAGELPRLKFVTRAIAATPPNPITAELEITYMQPEVGSDFYTALASQITTA